MKPLFLSLLLLATPAAAQTGQGNNAEQVFLYSPKADAGLHIAHLDAAGWHDLGQLCSSDYGTWGAEKKMHAPSVCRAKDGTWRLVFQVNDRSPVIAAAYSRDLITWRPQDYPIMSTRPCREPVVFENPVSGSFDIYYRSPEGKRFVSASADFRQFSQDEPSQISDDAWLRDTATIGGRLMEGNQFSVGSDFVAAIRQHFAALTEDARLSSERMHDDDKNLAWLKEPLKATLTVDQSRQKPISDMLVGIFFEDISYAADGGLYAELVQNRDFEYSSRDRGGWSAETAWHSPAPIRIGTDQPLSKNNPHYAIVATDSLWNEGWDGIAVEAGKTYDFSVFVRGKKKLTVQLITPNGTVIAQAKVKAKAADWTQYQVQLKPVVPEKNARLLLLPQGKEEAAIDMVSLFPRETFMSRKNGLRKDLAETIARLKPKFVRFPGGCMSHGQGLENIYHWNHTIGELQDRTPDFNIWHYHQTRGLGFFEYFQFCEDIGAEPLPVLAAGVPCQNSAANAEGIGGQQGGIPMAEMPAYIDELCNLIDWANADPATNEWAAKRAAAGHPAPFNLKYLGIGNEDIIGTVFEERYEMICRALRERHPEIKVCGTVGPFHTPSADYLEGWDLCRRHPEWQYMTDEHYYESTGWFMHHRDYYDQYQRTHPQPLPTGRGVETSSNDNSADNSIYSPPSQGGVGGGSAPVKVYLGEWAASTRVKRPNLETALAEALYLTDVERNGDIVEMTSYAPMLCKDGHSNWNPDMIYFSNTTVRTTPAYEVQRFFSVGSGDRYVSTQLSLSRPELQHRVGASLVVDSKTGKRYLKLVNALPSTLEVQVNGLDLPATMECEQFTGSNVEDQKAHTERITTSTPTVLPPYSLRLITL